MTKPPDTVVKRLREIADYAETDTSNAIWDYAEAIRGAADQIETLSASLEAGKVERGTLIQALKDGGEIQRNQIARAEAAEKSYVEQFDKREAAEAARGRWRSMWEKEHIHNEELLAELAALNTEIDLVWEAVGSRSNRSVLSPSEQVASLSNELGAAESERAALRAELAEAVDALENITIAIGMGWDLDGVVDVARHQKETDT